MLSLLITDPMLSYVSHLNTVLIGEWSGRDLDRGVTRGVMRAVSGANGSKLGPSRGQASTGT